MAIAGEVQRWIAGYANYRGSGCLIWPFSRNWNGYGHLGFAGKIRKAHRVMCELAHGEPPFPGMVAAHSCHNPQCVNPKHLSWKTPRENLMDRRKDGTLTKKRWTPRSGTLLSDDQIKQIVALKGKKNQREIGAMFGISYQHVSVIQNGKLKRQAYSSH